MLLAILVGLTFLMLAGAQTLRHARDLRMAEAAAWDINGPPCPMLDATAFAAKGYNLKFRHSYVGTEFARASGHVSCKEVGAEGGRSMNKFVYVCQFNSPIGLTVTRGGKTTSYDLGAGQPASITIREDRAAPRCVTAAGVKIN
ncbi:hypothetical protein [Phenylobacterium immobile]|uniref:hypothetical protein n=1 Tax=Phenylobacterium immobile TaxID=21 RepID=UPI000B1DD35C|nr:hypothetical protein [Phenylobacterium immobile]